jgi:type II secretory pathway component PulF
MKAPSGGTDASRVVPATTAIADFITLNEEIAAIVRARLPLEPHLARLGRELPGRAGKLAEQIGRRMESGATLAAAIDAECKSLPPAYRAAILAGTQSGDLGAALESLVDSATRLDQMRRVTGIAIIYPLLIVIVASVLLAVILSQVVPTFEWLNQPHFGVLTGLARWPLLVPVLALVVPIVVTVMAATWWWRSGRMNQRRSGPFASLAWLSGTGRVYRWSQAATFVELLRLLVERGLPLEQSLRLAGDAIDDRRLSTAAVRVADLIERGAAPWSSGQNLPSPAAELPLLIRVALRQAGDRALLLGGLRQAATMYRERAVRTAEWYAEYMPIALTVAVGGTLTIGFTLLVLWPYASTLYELAGWNWR